MGRLDSPTGTRSVPYRRMSAAMSTGYVNKPAPTSSAFCEHSIVQNEPSPYQAMLKANLTCTTGVQDNRITFSAHNRRSHLLLCLLLKLDHAPKPPAASPVLSQTLGIPRHSFTSLSPWNILCTSGNNDRTVASEHGSHASDMHMQKVWQQLCELHMYTPMCQS